MSEGVGGGDGSEGERGIREGQGDGGVSEVRG